MEPPLDYHLIFLSSFFSSTDFISAVIMVVSLLVLLFSSALISGSEVAFFSLSPTQLKDLESSSIQNDKIILSLIVHPQKLLATILITNNFVNIAIVILSTYILSSIEALHHLSIIYIFLIEVIGVTFLILLFGEVLPKVYATYQPLKLARFMSGPMLFLGKLLSPFSYLLIHSTSFIDNRIARKKETLSVEELEKAFELTEKSLHTDERKILKSIVKFGNTDVKQIMTPRTQVKAFDINLPFEELLKEAEQTSFSRLPVFKDSFDNISGVLYLKDLMPFMDKKTFGWNRLIRSPFFVPENKKIDDLLKEFQLKKVHLAIVVDEYGGTSGIVSLEDILEEIVGEITDEFDDEELKYSKLSDNEYIFEGATSLIDIYKVLGIDGEQFEKVKGEADTIAGFVIEQAGIIPKKGETIKYKNFEFVVKAADKRRIKQIQLIINPAKNE